MRLTMLRRMLGVTLLELLIVVVVVGILASIAVPSYRNYVMRTHRTDATTILLRIQSQQEKFFLQNNQYAATIAALGFTAVTEGGKYTVMIEQTRGINTFDARATPVAGQGQQADTRCQRFTIDETGQRGALDGGGVNRSNECWGRR